MFDQLEQSQLRVLTIISFGMVMLSIHHDLMVSVCFMYDPRDVLRQASPDDLSVKHFPCYIYQR